MMKLGESGSSQPIQSKSVTKTRANTAPISMDTGIETASAMTIDRVRETRDRRRDGSGGGETRFSRRVSCPDEATGDVVCDTWLPLPLLLEWLSTSSYKSLPAKVSC